jgi:prevent-host-death family protein
MKREVSVAEAKMLLSSLLNEVAFGGRRIVVLSRGKPKAALIGIEDLGRLESLPSHAEVAVVLKKAEALRRKISGRRGKSPPVDDLIATMREGRAR